MKIKPADALNILLLLGLAVLIWFYVQQQIMDTADVEFELDIRVSDADKFVVVSHSVGNVHYSGRITVKLRGSKSQLAELRGGEVRVVRLPVDVDEAAFANRDAPLQTTIKITDEDLGLPANVTIEKAVSLDVWVDIRETKKCEVVLNAADIGGRVEPPPEGGPKWRVKLRPQRVSVTGPRFLVNMREGLRIKTEAVDVKDLLVGTPKALALIDTAKDYKSAGSVPHIRPDLKLTLSPATVEATRTLQEEIVKITRENVAIKVLGTPEFFKEWEVEISGSLTRTLTLSVPESRRVAADRIKLELVLDTRQLNPQEVPNPLPQDLRVVDKPEWMEVSFEDRKVTITIKKRT